jgi:hypothetical protein
MLEQCRKLESSQNLRSVHRLTPVRRRQLVEANLYRRASLAPVAAPLVAADAAR